MKHTRTHFKGFVALTSVLILSALFLSVSISIALRAISGSEMSTALFERDRARYMAEACAEYAMMELTRTLNYNGDESILVGDDSCEILEIEGEGNVNRIVRTESNVGAHAYHLEVVISSVSPEMTISSYARVAHF